MRTWFLSMLAVTLASAACSPPDGADPVIEAVRRAASDADAAAVSAALQTATTCFAAGSFTMGRGAGERDEGPEHAVELDAFCVGRFEVTNAQYGSFVESTGTKTPPYWPGVVTPLDRFDLPVVGVGWDEADAYCRWAGGRLPTEAEWERACRAGEDRRYPWGNDWSATCLNVTASAVAHPDDGWPGALGTPVGSGAVLMPVGSIPCDATPDGVMDLAGNASEWIADWYDPDAYATLPDRNPLSSGPTWDHVVRGGAWLFPHDRPDDVPGLTTCTARNASHVDQSARIGFRCVFDADR